MEVIILSVVSLLVLTSSIVIHCLLNITFGGSVEAIRSRFIPYTLIISGLSASWIVIDTFIGKISSELIVFMEMLFSGAYMAFVVIPAFARIWNQGSRKGHG